MALEDKDPIRDLADRIIRDSLRHAEHLRGLLGRVVPDLVNGFQFEHLRPLDRDFPLEDWRRREADLPLEIPYGVGEASIRALVVVFLEHQSNADPMMPLRLLYFAVVYWDQQWRAWEAAPSPKPPFRLNPVLPIVVYTGATAWGSNRTLADLLGEPQAFHAFAPIWRPLFWNLAEQSPQELVSSDNNWLQLMAVLGVEDADGKRFEEILAKAVVQLMKIKESDEVRWYDLMRALLTWIYWRRPESERAALLAIVENAQTSRRRHKEIQQMVSKLGPSYWDLALERAMEVARVVAREEAREEAKEHARETAQQAVESARPEIQLQTLLQTLRDMLKTLLEDKLGRLPKKLQKQIDVAGDAELLRQAIRRVPDCPSLAEFHL